MFHEATNRGQFCSTPSVSSGPLRHNFTNGMPFFLPLLRLCSQERVDCCIKLVVLQTACQCKCFQRVWLNAWEQRSLLQSLFLNATSWPWIKTWNVDFVHRILSQCSESLLCVASQMLLYGSHGFDPPKPFLLLTMMFW